ncbi:MAG: IclR family transcriptional regulator C-terminal domain-containing protein, partial [Pseudomonadota bacterium]|nr:IclR family transcriptional regulator C-terminal domain-containing protein [Pseudomonadota bacterium]
LTALTPKTLTRVDAILAELASIRSQGFATIDQEVEPGLCSIAVPVLNSHGHTIAALNIGYSSTSATPETATTAFLPALLKVQSELRPLLT